VQISDIVECRSSASYAERPLAFTWQGQRLEVVEILSRWRTPAGLGFRVCTEQAEVFELVYNENVDEWSIHPHNQIKGIQHDALDDRDVQD
jgi:hypothetical protein